MSNTELINAYFDNELTPSEMKKLEDRLTQDTELQREFKFQEDIIEGIRETRRQSLKARLDQVQVGGSATGAGSWTAGKIAGLIGLAAIVGFGIYYIYPEDEQVINETPAIVLEDNESATDNDPAEIIPNENNEQQEITEETNENTSPVENMEEQAEDAVAEDTETMPEETAAVKEENKNPVIAPSFEDPLKQDTNVDLPAGEISGKAVINSENLEVSVDSESRRYEFHYRLDNDQLTLYGDFENDLYQILEFNTNDMKAWFLSYDNEFYHLKGTDGKVDKLEKVTDNALLQTLREASKE